MVALLPDGAAVLITFLSAHASLSPLHGGRVGTALQSTSASLRITQLGGARPTQRLWEGVPEFQVEAWGGSQADAALLARTVNAAIYDLRGPVAGGRVIAAYPTLEPLWSPDPDTGRARYLTQVQMHITPEA